MISKINQCIKINKGTQSNYVVVCASLEAFTKDLYINKRNTSTRLVKSNEGMNELVYMHNY